MAYVYVILVIFRDFSYTDLLRNGIERKPVPVNDERSINKKLDVETYEKAFRSRCADSHGPAGGLRGQRHWQWRRWPNAPAPGR
jgi:hypothetical protein